MERVTDQGVDVRSVGGLIRPALARSLVRAGVLGGEKCDEGALARTVAARNA